MKSWLCSALFLAAGTLAMPSTLCADEIDRSKVVPSETETAAKNKATGRGVINSVNEGKQVINITHEPMPDLGWPVMTMDLPVTKKVDLSEAKPGDKVVFTIKLGRDKKYRVVKMSPAK